MDFLKKIFNKVEQKDSSYSDFWDWFLENHDSFFNIVKNGENPESFFNKLSPKLDELKSGYFFLSGMFDNETAELVFTPDGNIKNIVFVEELVQSAPKINNWKFTALKPELDIDDVGIKIKHLDFTSEHIWFYPNDYNQYPDEVDIVIVYKDYSENNKTMIFNGIYIFLDNYLGELNAVTTIDNLTVIGKDQATADLIPITKLKDFLNWRQKEFVEKYSGKRYNTENDNFSSLEAKLENGNPLIAVVNSTLLDWDCKASHPWILSVIINYDGENNNGLPNKETYVLLDTFEDQITHKLKDFDGYLNIGRQTADHSREIYFACKDFRKPSKVLYQLICDYKNLDINYDLYKDKYWQSFERFRVN